MYKYYFTAAGIDLSLLLALQLLAGCRDCQDQMDSGGANRADEQTSETKSVALQTGPSFDENVLKRVTITIFVPEMLHKNICRVKVNLFSVLLLKDLPFNKLTEAERSCAAVIPPAMV